MKTLLSLYDYTGNWSRPFANGGWNVILWDIKHEPDMYGKFKEINKLVYNNEPVLVQREDKQVNVFIEDEAE